MRVRIFSRSLSVLLLLPILLSYAQPQPRIEAFIPQGTVKRVRQVQVRFSDPMVPFGDPREVITPFDIDCPEKGVARWVDSRNWVYDFNRDLKAGVRCEFRIRQGLKTLAGQEITGQRNFRFSTGGPAILIAEPYEGSTNIDEEQIFILELDAMPTEASVLSNVFFAVEGISDRVSVRIVSGEERDQILKEHYPYRSRPPGDILLIQAKQKFPAGSRIRLIWGRGVQSESGVATETAQILPFETRTPFTITFHCQRENPQADCIPITPMRLSFSAPLAWEQARKAVLRDKKRRRWTPARRDPEGDDKHVQEIVFNGPFAEKSEFVIEIPPGLVDDAGRKLTNAASFPLTIRTDEYPPLAKFSADFGIIELKGNPALPVTLRNVEPQVTARMLEVTEGAKKIEVLVQPDEKSVSGRMKGKLYRVSSDKAVEIIAWLKKMSQRSWEDRDKSIFGDEVASKARGFSIPKLHGTKAFEVLGIPIPEPGFYVVEIESELLGAALLGIAKPMYVPTTALVTNLSVHFKWGIESSLVWVTTLDRARPVREALVQARDGKGELLWEGLTDRNGVARIDKLPSQDKLAVDSHHPLDRGLLVTATAGEDMSFVHSIWNEGIEPWRFRLPMEYDRELITAHTVFDRTLFRASETVHMKHFLRRRAGPGFSPIPDGERPISGVIEHLGSEDKYPFSPTWDSNGTAATEWKIPKGAKLGWYQVYFPKDQDAGDFFSHRYSGRFRVEEYRVPLMRGAIRAPSETLVSPPDVAVDVAVQYLAGGAASTLPVRFRHQIEPRYISPFEGFEDFQFSNGRVVEGIFRHDPDAEFEERKSYELKSQNLVLDTTGTARAHVSGLPKAEKPLEIVAELEFRDPNGELQTVSSRIPLWPSNWLIGIRPDSWVLSRESLRFQVAVVDLKGKPVAGAPVKVDIFQQKTYSHRKRLVGGFYAYEHSREVKRLETTCEGLTDRRGLVLCEKPSPLSGNLILQASARDPQGYEAVAQREVWVAGKEDWWFSAEDGDRIDVLPEKKRYEPGERARFQVRMPFRSATALITIEREGVGEVLLKELSGKEPVFEVPVKGNYAPNVYISVLVVRGRAGGIQPTATVDLGRPAYKLGIAEINVGWKAHELKVQVTSDRPVYKVREKARVNITVRMPDGKLPPRGGEVALAAVDEGLLELMPNTSWDLLQAMMGRRSYGVQTSTAQVHVIGKRHFGLKALPEGGGGGKQTTRELFDTLLLWKGRIPLDENGTASAEIPLNDSLTSFRFVAIASAGLDRFGTGSTSVRSTQDLMIFSGLPPVVRQGDRFRSEFTLRNATDRAMEVQVSARVRELSDALPPASISLAAGEAREVAWNIIAPTASQALRYELEAKASTGTADRLAVEQKIVPAVPERPVQATISQLEADLRIPVERPKDALPGRGGVNLVFRPTLLDGLAGVAEYMSKYPYRCLEQEISRAIALKDSALWTRLMAELPSYLDGDGLAKYFPSMYLGSDTLTSYLIAIAHEAGWEIPQNLRGQMTTGLQGFVEGRVIRFSSMPTADLSIRKIAAIEALSRHGLAAPNLLSSVTIEPNLWPTSAVIDWWNILKRVPQIRGRSDMAREAEQILRSRLNLQGTTMGFSTERRDFLWWLMVSTDTNASRFLLSVLDSPVWKEDTPRLVRGILGRQKHGHWDTTIANAWGVLATEKFSLTFEKTPVSGRSAAVLHGKTDAVDWSATPKGKTLSFAWPPQRSELLVRPLGAGKPWVTLQALAAIPLREPLSTGFTIKKTLTPVEQKQAGSWTKGDIVRVTLQLEAQADMTWAVVSDPIPAGSAILGTGLGTDSRLATRGEDTRGSVWPAFEERSFEHFRAYYEYVPKGTWTVEYTFRINNEGVFQLPPTRIEALYSPEMFGEIPNEPVRVGITR